MDKAKLKICIYVKQKKPSISTRPLTNDIWYDIKDKFIELKRLPLYRQNFSFDRPFTYTRTMLRSPPERQTNINLDDSLFRRLWITTHHQQFLNNMNFENKKAQVQTFRFNLRLCWCTTKIIGFPTRRAYFSFPCSPCAGYRHQENREGSLGAIGNRRFPSQVA